MAMTMQVSGLEDVSRMLTEVGEKAGDVAAKALYDGAGVMADAYAEAVNGMGAEKFRYAFNGRKRLASIEEKAALVGKSGIAKFEKNGSEVLTSISAIGDLGYVQIAGRRIAVRLIANAVNKGTDFRKKDAVFSRAVSKAKGAASAAIVSKAEKLIDEMTK